jgi:TolB protein
MRRLLRRLLGPSAPDATAGRRPRRDSAVYALELRDGRAVAGTLRRLSPEGDFTQPMVSPNGTKVAYWGRGAGDDSLRIWVSSLDHEPAPVRLTGQEGMQGHPYWHPDGVRLVHFASRATSWDASRQFSPDRAPSQLWWLDTCTGAASQLTDGSYTDERPAVTPDGSGVVFVSNRSGRLNLWRVKEDGSGLTQLTEGTGPDYRPCISPDGQWLAYFSAASDGSHQVRVRSLADGRELDCSWTGRFRWSHGPFWCPDGRSLLVHARERGATSPALWIVDLESGSAERLDTPGVAGASHGTIDAAARWLVFDCRQAPGP